MWEDGSLRSSEQSINTTWTIVQAIERRFPSLNALKGQICLKHCVAEQPAPSFLHQ